MKNIAILATLVALPVVGITSARTAQAPPWKLTAARDSFVVTINGRTMGAAVYAIERLPQGFRVTETTRIAGMVEQATEIQLDEHQRVLSVSQKGKMRGQEMRIELRYEKGRVQGSVQVPGPQGVLSHDVDREVPADVVDDNLMQAVIGALAWSAQTRYTVPVFSSGKNVLAEMRLSVVDVTPESYKVEVAGENGVVHFYVSRESPQRILRVAPAGQPIELVRVN